MTVPTKAALICDIVKDVKDIQCDFKTIGEIAKDLLCDHNPCNIKWDLKALACLEKDVCQDFADLKCDIHQLECLYHCSYSAPV
jgi:hypothetical protein